MTLEELKALYKEKGAAPTQRITTTEQGDQIDYLPTELAEGWSAWEKPGEVTYEGGMDSTPTSGPASLGGFSRQDGDYTNFYDTNGKLVSRQKWNESMLKTTIQDLGPIVMAALTAGGGAGLQSIGNSLFGLTGAAAAGAGGALAGGINAYGNNQNILKGALLGGVAGGGAQELGKIGDTTVKVGDVTKAINLAQNPTLGGALNFASPYVNTNMAIGDTGYTTNDLLKGFNTVQALGSGDNSKIFKAITGLAGGAGSGGTGSTVESNITELTPEDIAELAPGELQAYKDKGVQGLADFRTDMRLLRSLSKSGYTGIDDITGDYTANNTTNNTTVNSDQDILDYLNSLGTDEIKDSGLSNQDIMNMIGGGTDDTVVVTGDRPTGLGDFMVPTTGNVAKSTNAADKGEMVITGNRNGTSLDDFLGLNTPVGNVTDNYVDGTDTVLVTGNKNNTALDDFIGLNTPVGDISNNYADDNTVVVNGKRECAPGFHDNGMGLCVSDDDVEDDKKDDDIDELVVTDKKECAEGFHDDGTGLCVADDDEEKPTDCPDGYILDLETNQCVKIDDVTKTVPPTKKTTTTTPTKTTTTTKTSEDLMASLGLGSGRVAPSQDPYANIKLMEELFGGDIGYKLRSLGAPKNTASADMDALMKLLRG
jgi:hypothetical protein